MPSKRRPGSSELRERAEKLRLYGLLSEWATFEKEACLLPLIEAEEAERTRRSEEYRLRNAKIGTFKDRADFDWKHPKKIDRRQIEELSTLDFLEDGRTVAFVAGNGTGPTMLARTLAHAAAKPPSPTRSISPADLLPDPA